VSATAVVQGEVGEQLVGVEVAVGAGGSREGSRWVVRLHGAHEVWCGKLGELGGERRSAAC
jgi:hypothetical protein